MAKTILLRARVDIERKNRAEKILGRYGLDARPSHQCLLCEGVRDQRPAIRFATERNRGFASRSEFRNVLGAAEDGPGYLPRIRRSSGLKFSDQVADALKALHPGVRRDIRHALDEVNAGKKRDVAALTGKLAGSGACVSANIG